MDFILLCGLSIVVVVLLIFGVEYSNDDIKGGFFSIEDSWSLRGVAAMMVVLGHSYQWLSSQISQEGIVKIFGLFYSQFGGLAVMVFFFLSGYGIQKKYKNNLLDMTFIKNRLRSVYGEYLKIKILFLLVEVILGTVTTIEILHRMVAIITIEEWFILIILIEYLLYYICKRINNNYWELILFLLNIIVAFGFWILKYEDRYYNSFWLFLFGVFVAGHSEVFRRFNEKRKLCLLWLIVIFVGFGMLFLEFKTFFIANLFKVIVGVAMCSVMVVIFRMITLKSTVLMWIGKNSLQLYIIHISLYELLIKIYSYNINVFIMLTFILLILLYVCKKRIGAWLRNANK